MPRPTPKEKRGHDLTDLKPVLVIGNKRYSSWSLRPWLALRMANIEFDEIKVKLWQTGKTAADIKSHNPSGTVPALKLGGTVIAESLAICEWAADINPAAELWPGDVTTRAVARAYASEMHSGFTALRRDMPMDVCGQFPGEGHSDAALADAARVMAIWNDCRENYGSAGPFLFGHFTNADAMFAPVVSRLQTYGVKTDAVSAAYIDAVWSLPAVAEWIAEAETEEPLPGPL